MSQFEREIKQLLENYEGPADNSAWRGVEQKLNGSSSNSFLKQFVVAGSILTVAMIGLSTDFNQSNVLDHSDHIAEAANNGSNHNSEKLNDISTNEILFVEDNSNEQNSVSNSVNAEIEKEKTSHKQSIVKTEKISTKNLSDLEKENLIGINESIKEKAERKSPVTEYVGENFNLNANLILTPNGDNKNDVFLPDALVEADTFIMKIFDKEGAMIFSTSSIENPWTGYNQITGVKTENGKYRWKVTLDNNNRREIFTGKIVVKN